MTTIFPILEGLFLPPGLFLIVLLVGIGFLAAGRQQLGGLLAAAAAVLLYLSSITPVAALLLRPLQGDYPPLEPAKASGARYVVVLGAGVVPRSPAAGGGPALGPASLKRLVYGEELARRTGLPLILSGGIVPSHPSTQSEAEVAKRTLRALGEPVARVLLEVESRNTWENARNVERIYHPGKVILVTSAYHMPRSALAFNRNHIQVVPAPTDYLATGTTNLYSYFPDASALRDTAIALKEYLGYLYYRLFLFTTTRSS